MAESDADTPVEAENRIADDVVVSECRRWIAMGYNDGWLRVFDTASRAWAWEVSKVVFCDRWLVPGRIFIPPDTGVLIVVTPHHVLFFDVQILNPSCSTFHPNLIQSFELKIVCHFWLKFDHTHMQHIFCEVSNYK